MAIAALLILSACGGGSDITNPPGTFTLAVAGEGAGAGRVSTSPGAQPALDCALAGSASPTGVCSANYAEGAVVALTVTPEAGSTFDGWAGDASGCATAPSCSITMTQNHTAVARLSPGSAAVQITSSAFHPDPDFALEGAVIWVVEVRNPSSQIVESARIEFTSHDAAGAVLASDFTFVGPIPPGETRAGKGFAEYLGTEATADFQVGEVQFATEDPGLSSARVASSNWRVDPEFGGTGAVIWTVEVENTTNAQLEEVEVDFITYDAAGKIITVDNAFVGPIPPGEKRSGEGFADYYGTETTVQFQIGNVVR